MRKKDFSYSQGPAPKYIGNNFYSQLVKKYERTLMAPEERINEILSASKKISFLNICLKNSKSTIQLFKDSLWPLSKLLSIPIIILQAIISDINRIQGPFLIYIILNLFGLLSYWLCHVLLYLLEDAETENSKRILQMHDSELSPLRENALQACKTIFAEWDTYCESYRGYPPDWAERKGEVRLRDDYKCKKCGWPDGVKRMARNVHVHHIIPITQGGDNSLDNLITLCHVCHKKEEGSGHSRIKYQKRRDRYG